MLHACPRAARGTLLFRDWTEARALWDRLTAGLRFRALVLMPDHVHLQLTDAAQLAPLAVALRSYARWRNGTRGESGPVWEYRASPTPIRGKEHVERTTRYLHLNPCRRGLVDDPLAWPFSTHRDAVGLALPAVRPPFPNPERFHAWVSGDPTVDPRGTSLPRAPNAVPAMWSLQQVTAAVSALTRTPAPALRTRGPVRSLLISAAAWLAAVPDTTLAPFAGVDRTTVRRAAKRRDPRLAVVEQVIGDGRFALLREGDLRKNPAWRAYRHLR
jgi:REP element-mobilizing transposase RayT